MSVSTGRHGALYERERSYRNRPRNAQPTLKALPKINLEILFRIDNPFYAYRAHAYTTSVHFRAFENENIQDGSDSSVPIQMHVTHQQDKQARLESRISPS